MVCLDLGTMIEANDLFRVSVQRDNEAHQSVGPDHHLSHANTPPLVRIGQPWQGCWNQPQWTRTEHSDGFHGAKLYLAQRLGRKE